MKFDYTFKNFFLFVGLFISVGCQPTEDSAPSEADAGPYTIVCTIGMIADVVRNVAGEYAVVEGIIGEGVDPHLYKPTRGDVVKLSQADVVFYNGLLLEGKMTEVLESVARTGKTVQAVTDGIVENTDYLLSGGSGHHDPHVWMDVSGWMQVVRVVTATLQTYDPARAETYATHAADYLEQLALLHRYAKAAMATIPETQRILVTAHDAFNYLGRAYGIEVRGIQGVSTESEAGVRDLEDIVDFIVARKIPAVFVETSVADKNVRALVEGTQARGHRLVIGGSLYSDAMGQTGTYEGTYIGMIDHNVTTIANALGGVANGFKEDKKGVVNYE
jgi:manganese/zinc/iron transport system substrate-binding protein